MPIQVSIRRHTQHKRTTNFAHLSISLFSFAYNFSFFFILRLPLLWMLMLDCWRPYNACIFGHFERAPWCAIRILCCMCILSVARIFQPYKTLCGTSVFNMSFSSSWVTLPVSLSSNPRQLLTGRLKISFAFCFFYCCRCCNYIALTSYHIVLVARFQHSFRFKYRAETISDPSIQNIWYTIIIMVIAKFKQHWQRKRVSDTYKESERQRTRWTACMLKEKKSAAQTQVIVMKQKSCHWTTCASASACTYFIFSFISLFLVKSSLLFSFREENTRSRVKISKNKFWVLHFDSAFEAEKKPHIDKE